MAGIESGYYTGTASIAQLPIRFPIDPTGASGEQNGPDLKTRQSRSENVFQVEATEMDRLKVEGTEADLKHDTSHLTNPCYTCDQ